VRRYERYGPPKPEYEAGAMWLNDFIEAHDLKQDRISQVLGVNHARVYEWRYQQRELPVEAQEMLEALARDGYPKFCYWLGR
jgi:hypothetical protein